ncbi:hypothetical protein LTR56_011991 [Elasticomyces elasticus]|nr:hypothetical protein LTR22_018090 [Elasticomyces elasticus]KAK3640195.1 hypothetical protein LTR56_011991 [Elasticomyces elasticus]KAK4913288.1 hypothetical protein LTR49_018361 [Elasticomyces elasticus]KAK5749010.1 hypothetical protein LTS12_020908 [Elasticomyces elasticus]
MPISWLALSLAEHIYPLTLPPPQGSKDLKVLCLGLPRSGTDSLRRALMQLGYDKVAHGLEWWLENPTITPVYMRLAYSRSQKQRHEGVSLRSEFFDRILGDYEAVTDIPAVWFPEELLRAYPNAKVILNRRHDVAAWKSSFRGSVLPIMQNRRYWSLSWFEPGLFWGMWLTLEMHQTQLFRGDFEENAETAYAEHYERLESVLREQGRTFLPWGVEDGWGPLCAFLDQRVPQEVFPSGNVAADFGPKLLTVDDERFRIAERRAYLLGATIAILVAVVVYQWW